MSATDPIAHGPTAAERSRRNRRAALWLLALAAAFYVGFIVLSVTSGHQ